MRIEQTLHGYSDGHRLLAASVELPRDARHVMLGLSDLSGRSPVEGFEDYLTGYPVPNTGLYAVAKTWYAPEMDRPGCVWTHTLLVPPSDLGSIRHLATLTSLFKRPTRAKSWKDYELAFVDPRLDDVSFLSNVTEAAGPVLRGLYETVDNAVLLPADNSKVYEHLVLEIWSQQWLKLRTTFRFSTGAIAARVLSGKSFDLQVVPVANVREVKRELGTTQEVIPLSSRDSIWPTWVAVALSDLSGVDAYRFRSFLHRIAIDFAGGREAFSSLAELFLLEPDIIAADTTLSHLVELVARRYPEPIQGAGLKQLIFGSNTALLSVLVDKVSEADLLRTLAMSGRAGAFSAEDLDVEERARALWKTSRDEAIHLIDQLIRQDHNSLGESILFALVRGLGANEAIRYLESIPTLAVTFVRLNPQAATAPELWRGSSDQQWKMFDAATAAKDNPSEFTRALVHAMLTAGSDVVADAAIRRLGPEVISAVLQWFDGSVFTVPSQLPGRWRKLLAENPGTMIDWLASVQKLREITAALIADLCYPHSSEVHKRGAAPWLKKFSQSDEGDQRATLRLRAFLLAFGFDNTGPGSDELVVRSFASVHEALSVDRLGDDSWSWLEEHVPTLSWLRNWDRCERLRRALADKFAKSSWPAAQYVHCAGNAEMLDSMLRSCLKTDGSKDLLERIDGALLSGDLKVDSDMKKVLKRFI